jgi:aminopeptidase N
MRFFQITIILVFTSTLFAQRQTAVDFTRVYAVLIPNPLEKEITGNVIYEFDILKDVDSVFLNAVNMKFTSVEMPEEQFKYNYDNNLLILTKRFEAGQSYSFMVTYSTKPKQTVYFSGWDDTIKGNEQIWTQGQGKYTSHWLPSIDDMNEKIVFDIGIVFDSDFEVISNGHLITENLARTSKNKTIWDFDMWNPMSSYLAAFAVGNFDKRELTSSSGVPIELYYEPKDSLKVEPTYRYSKEIFDFLEQEIGVSYPWQNYKQVPVQDFLYAGMENTSTTIFSNTYMIDSTAFVDKNYVNVNAHELAHQWFGNLVTEKSSKHHWLHEGFATYYAYLAEQHLFGDDHFYWKLYATAKTLHNLSESEGGEALTNPNANSLTFYEKGAWALVMLKEKVGKTDFDAGVKEYLRKHQFKNVTISDFLVEVERTSEQSLEGFKEKWLESEQFPWEEAKQKLKKESKSLRLVFEMEDEFQGIKSDDLDFEAYWDKSGSSNVKQYLIKKYHRILPETVLNKAFSSNDIKIRQALATSLYGISGAKELTKELTARYETLLEDKSYITIESALVKLWSTFPEKRANYFSKTKNVIGLPNKNVRLLWLTLALVTPEYQPSLKDSFYQELNGYTATHHHFEIRQLAFQYLSQIQALSDASLVNLIKASEHHVWQFKKSSRNLLKELSESNDYKTRLLTIAKSLDEKERTTLNQLINQ